MSLGLFKVIPRRMPRISIVDKSKIILQNTIYIPALSADRLRRNDSEAFQNKENSIFSSKQSINKRGDRRSTTDHN